MPELRLVENRKMKIRLKIEKCWNVARSSPVPHLSKVAEPLTIVRKLRRSVCSCCLGAYIKFVLETRTMTVQSSRLAMSTFCWRSSSIFFVRRSSSRFFFSSSRSASLFAFSSFASSSSRSSRSRRLLSPVFPAVAIRNIPSTAALHELRLSGSYWCYSPERWQSKYNHPYRTCPRETRIQLFSQLSVKNSIRIVW